MSQGYIFLRSINMEKLRVEKPPEINNFLCVQKSHLSPSEEKEGVKNTSNNTSFKSPTKQELN